MAGFTDSTGTFRFDQLWLPARLRSSDGLTFIENGTFTATVALSRAPNASSGELAPATLNSLPSIALLVPRSRTAEAARLAVSFDLISAGPTPGTIIVRVSPRRFIQARAGKLEIVVLDADSNSYAMDADALASEADWKAILNQRIAAGRAAFKRAELGQSRRPRSRVREAAGCRQQRQTP
ncbi:MAG: hypothetical protein QM756_02835 [Polyangiaceae bacterium]